MSKPALTLEDLPLVAIGSNVYRRRVSSPMCVAETPEMAAEIAGRLNHMFGTVEPPRPSTGLLGGQIIPGLF